MTNLLKHAAHNKQVDNALRIAIEAAWDKLDDKPVQKPVACRFCHDKKGSWAWQCYKCGEIDDVQQPAQPVAQRQWVGLTEEEIMVIGDKVANEKLVGLVLNFRGRLARAIEQTLKERNHG